MSDDGQEQEIIDAVDDICEQVSTLVEHHARRLGLDEAEMTDRVINELTARREP